jgi:lysophospholipase L1-like esterase
MSDSPAPRPKRRIRSALIVAITVAAIAATVGVVLTVQSNNAPQARQVVVLGDSYASGEGMEPYEEGTDTGQSRCHRSALAFPGQIDELEVFDVTNVSCSGAQLDALTQSFRTEPSQLSHVGGKDAVVMMLGGNDVDALSYVFDPDAIDQFETRLPELQSELESSYQLLRQEVEPDTQIVIVGYPSPLGGTNPQNCFFEPEQVAAVENGAQQINTIISLAAQNAGFEFVDNLDAFAGHGLCDSEPWVNNVDLANLEGSLHPNEEGHRVLADRVRAALS